MGTGSFQRSCAGKSGVVQVGKGEIVRVKAHLCG